MDYFDLTESKLNQLPPKQRLEQMIKLIKHSDDESQRWDCVCLCGELYHKLSNREYKLSHDETSLIKTKITMLFQWILQNEKNAVVLHEACYHIAARNLRGLIPDLIYCATNSNSILGRHEALESLGLMNAQEAISEINHALDDPIRDIRETAQFVLKRIQRYKKETYVGLEII